MRFNLLLFILSTLSIGCTEVAEDNNADSQPNILLILTDQQHAETMSVAGNPHLSTPAMDMLASQGTRFTRAYCTSPVCGPARSSIITGRMPHETGVVWNGQSIQPGINNVGELLKEAGYRTVWGGKWHLPESYPQRSRADSVAGFELLPFYDPDKTNWFLGAETDPPLTLASVDFLNQYDQEQPLFMALSYHNPHDICFYARKDGWVSAEDSLLEIRYYGFEHHLPDVIGKHPSTFDSLPPLPANYARNTDEPQFLTDKRTQHREYGVETYLTSQEFGEEEWRGYLNAYHELTEMVDSEIGKVIETLKSKGMWENTLIIFSSDHGDGAASHQWAAKLNLYEESANIPLIVAQPGNLGSRVDSTHLVSQIDIVPTILDFAGVETNASITGQSLMPIVKGANTNWRDKVVTELADYKPDPTRQGRMLRSDSYKYNVYSNGEEQLFNLAGDPGETQNLANLPDMDSIKQQHRKLLSDWIRDTGDDFILP